MMRVVLFGLPALIGLLSSLAAAAEPKSVLLFGQRRDHAPGAHEYLSGLKVLAKCLDGLPDVKTETINLDAGDVDEVPLIARADAIVLSLGQGGMWMQASPRRLEAIEALAKRGGAIVGIHSGICAKKDAYVAKHIGLMGGIHGGSDRKYTIKEFDVRVIDRQHAIVRGVSDMRLDDEYYYRLKFSRQGKVSHLLEATIEGRPEPIAWAYQRPDGGRSFGFGGMHYHKNWSQLGCRRLIAQGILWCLDLPIPEDGLPCQVTEDDLKMQPDSGKRG